MARAKSIQIYLKEGIEQDDLLLALWSVLRFKGRPQESYRKMLILGFEAMKASGEFSDSILEELEATLEEGLPEPATKRSPPRKTVPERPADPAPSRAAPDRDDRPQPAPREERAPQADAPPVRDEKPASPKGETAARPSPKTPFIGDLM